MNFAQKTARKLLALPVTVVLLPLHLVTYYSDKEFESNSKTVRSLKGWVDLVAYLVLFVLTPLLLLGLPLFVIYNTLTGRQCQISRFIFGVEE